MNSTHVHAMQTARTASILNVIAGIWLIISPFFLHYVGMANAITDSVVVGIVVLILGLARAADPSNNISGLSWVNFLLGL